MSNKICQACEEHMTQTTPEHFKRMKAFLTKNVVSAMTQNAPSYAQGFQEILVYIEEQERLCQIKP